MPDDEDIGIRMLLCKPDELGGGLFGPKDVLLDIVERPAGDDDTVRQLRARLEATGYVFRKGRRLAWPVARTPSGAVLDRAITRSTAERSASVRARAREPWSLPSRRRSRDRGKHFDA